MKILASLLALSPSSTTASPARQDHAALHGLSQGEAVFDAASVDRSAGAAADLQREAMLDTLLAVTRGEMPELLAAIRPA